MRTSPIRGIFAVLLLSLTLLVGCGGALAPGETTTPAAGTVSPALLGTGLTATSVTSAPAVLDGYQTIRVDQLPPEARDTLALIAEGGPFPYRQDGVVFQNREGYLPSEPDGYYHEYTVKTPGASDRGARRIITGSQGEMYYTDDHYVTFKRIVQ